MKHLILTTALTLVSMLTCAQTNSFTDSEENPDIASQVDYILENLNMSTINTGLLLDYGLQMSDLSNLSGALTSDTLKDFSTWGTAYFSLLTSDINDNQPIGEMSDWENTADQLLSTNVIPMMGLYVGFHQFLQDSALLSTRIMEIDGQLYDTWSGSNSPYEYKEAFAVCPKKTTVYNSLTQTFRFTSQFYISNRNKVISSIQIDFDNGQGYQTVSAGVNKSVTWAGYGIKTFKTKITYTDSTVKHSYSSFLLVNNDEGSGSTSMAKYDQEYDDILYAAHPTVPNHGVKMYIEYGCNHTSLIKPFIYVKGFYPEEFTSNLTYSSLYRRLLGYESDFSDGYPLLRVCQYTSTC